MLCLLYTSHLPVSVCGTGTTSLSRRFSWQRGIMYFGSVEPSPSRLSIMRADLPTLDVYKRQALSLGKIMTVPKEEATANYVPAAAVIRRWRALSGFTGRKGSVGG